MRDNDDRLPGVLARDTLHRLADTQREPRPAFRVRRDGPQRLRDLIHPAEARLVLVHAQAVPLVADTQLLHRVVEHDRQPQGGRDNLGGLPGARQRTGDKRVGTNLAGSLETVAQPLRLPPAKFRQPRIAAHPSHNRLDIAIRLPMPHQV